MTTPTIIGLTGRAGTGKDTVRAILEEHGFFGMAFADPIRDMLREMLISSGISDVYMDDRDFKEAIIPELGTSYRRLAQTLGTEWGRSIRDDFWLQLAGAHMADLQDCAEVFPHNFVLSDVRFQNEADWVRARGGVIWHIQRSAATPVRAHVSESEMENIAFDQLIWNDGSLGDLRNNVNQALLFEKIMAHTK